jgi:hypothetical protein
MSELTSPRMLADGRVCCSHSEGLCPDCRAHFATNSLPVAPRAAASAVPPDPYAAGLAALRAQERS